MVRCSPATPVNSAASQACCCSKLLLLLLCWLLLLSNASALNDTVQSPLTHCTCAAAPATEVLLFPVQHNHDAAAQGVRTLHICRAIPPHHALLVLSEHLIGKANTTVAQLKVRSQVTLHALQEHAADVACYQPCQPCQAQCCCLHLLSGEHKPWLSPPAASDSFSSYSTT